MVNKLGGISSPTPRNRIRPRPLVVFDMAFKTDERFPVAVTGAGLSLATMLTSQGAADVTFLKNPLYNRPTTKLPSDRPLIFCLTLYDRTWKRVQRECEAIQKHYPKARIIIGGPGVTQFRRDFRELIFFFPEATAFVKGDGEPVIAPLVQVLSKRSIDFEKVGRLKGIYVFDRQLAFKSDRPIYMVQAEYAALPPANFEYRELVNDIKKTGRLFLNTSLGCKYRCVFCAEQKHPPVSWPAERIISELQRIKELIEQGTLPPEARAIAFNDDDFFGNRQRARAFLEGMAADPALRDYFFFDFQTRVDTFVQRGQIDTALLDKLQKLQITGLCFGSDGFHPSTLRFLQKGNYSVDDILALAAELKRRQIAQIHYAILTYPGITRPELAETIETLFELTRTNRTFRASISTHLLIYEGNQLFRRYLNDHPRLLADRGMVKILPFTYPLADQQLESLLQKAFFTRLPTSRQFEQAIAAKADNRVIEPIIRELASSCEALYQYKGRVTDIFKRESSRHLRMLALEYLAECLQEKGAGRKSLLSQIREFEP